MAIGRVELWFFKLIIPKSCCYLLVVLLLVLIVVVLLLPLLVIYRKCVKDRGKIRYILLFFMNFRLLFLPDVQLST